MRKLNVLLYTGTFMLTATSAFSDDNTITPDLKLLMTPGQYKAAGLDKLTEEERKALSDWLQSYSGKADAPKISPGNSTSTTSTATTAAVAAQPTSAQAPATRVTEENFGLPEPQEYSKKDAFELKASIVKPFRGWSGKTVFTLDNGQVWKQRASGKYTYMGEDTRVIISQNRWGFYDLRLVAADRSVGVKRVK